VRNDTGSSTVSGTTPKPWLRLMTPLLRHRSAAFVPLSQSFCDRPTPKLCYTPSYEDIVIIGGTGARRSASGWQKPPDQLGCLPDWCGMLVHALVCGRFGYVKLPFWWLGYDRRDCAVVHRGHSRVLALQLPNLPPQALDSLATLGRTRVRSHHSSSKLNPNLTGISYQPARIYASTAASLRTPNVVRSTPKLINGDELFLCLVSLVAKRFSYSSLGPGCGSASRESACARFLNRFFEIIASFF
jgi:hypothetical protein